jgi:FkbM family methyltransferase
LATFAATGLELVRRLARHVTPRPLYDRLHHALNVWAAVARLGRAEARKLQRAARATPGGPPLAIRVPALPHPIHIRPGTTDAGEVIHSLVREAYRSALPEEPVELILDGGANLGDTACFYLARFPRAHLTAVEPDVENFALAAANLEPYGPRARVIQAGVWPRDAELTLVPSPLRSGLAVREAGPGEPVLCRGVSPLTLLEESGRGRIDLFKCDIEGAELPLFAAPEVDAWLSRTRLLVIEIHGAEAAAAVHGATRRLGFTVRRFRDLHVFRRPPRP